MTNETNCCEDSICLCSTDGIINLIAKKWTLCIINHLGNSENGYRFNELQRSMDGVSPKSLSNRLKELQQVDLVDREVVDSKPPVVIYNLTDNGRELNDKLEPLITWIEERY